MRKIDWENPLSDEDVAWLRQAGFMSEERIAAHQAQFDKEVPEPEVPEDNLTKSAMDPAARVADPVPGMGDGAPVLVDPREQDNPGPEGTEDEDLVPDDYDQWKVSELENEVTARNEMPDTTMVTVEGTGKNNSVTKPDLIKGLRLWDQENPDAIQPV